MSPRSRREAREASTEGDRLLPGAHALAEGGPDGAAVDADRVELHVRDDGRGFDAASPEARTGHFGLLGMRERADQLGGERRLRSGPDRGTEVVVAVPVGK